MATGRSSRIVTNAGQPGTMAMDMVGKCPVVRWRDVGQEGVMAFMSPILAENRPFLMTGYWSHQVLNKDATQRWRSFPGIKSVLTSHGLEDLRVDVACTKKGQSFRGDQASRQQVSLRLVDLVELAEASDAGKPHWATAEEVGLDYYLCQCPVVSREEGKPEVLGALAGEFRTPSCVAEEDLLQINLWLGAMETTTNMHYDANHNLLFVLKGRKRVAILPPNMTPGVQAMPVFSESANHSGLDPSSTAEVVGSEEAMKMGAVYADIGEGEGLFIPEGWWHQITSAPGTVAVNVWFKGVRPALCDGPSRHMREYYLRCLVESLLTDRLKEAAETNSVTATTTTTAPSIPSNNHSNSDMPGATADGKVTGMKRPRTAPPPPPASVEQSPLSAPASTVAERNRYLRTIGATRMGEELPKIASTCPPDWARLVTGLDPLTAHVLTTQWEQAGGVASMPDFYEAIFGGGSGTGIGEGGGADSGPGGEVPASVKSEVDGTIENSEGAAVDLGSGRDGIGVPAFGDGMDFAPPLPQAESPHDPPEQSHLGMEGMEGEVEGDVGVGEVGDVVACGRAEEYIGVALQARLVRLRETFAHDECRKLLHKVVGL